ncbi:MULTISPECIES: hypothetical protein [Clostridium]|uniref:Uncharacterized protein n=1 Tax=Clostridium disporicum TaxID=84024 RepID=A0A174AIA2_9CLOT|nr:MULTISPECIES: hypothetical protein [Clostridium]CUN87196.1 Uncharacterised protein [Clostridium disporicum]
MKEKFKCKIEKLKKEVNSFKDKILKTTKTKIFWCEVLIITAICSFIVTNFLLNFFIGMYLLSLLLFSIGLFIWKYL